MDTQQISDLLRTERNRLDQAILALQGQRRRGRPPKLSMTAEVVAPGLKPAGKHRSAASRALQSKKMKAYWAKRKATKLLRKGPEMVGRKQQPKRKVA